MSTALNSNENINADNKENLINNNNDNNINALPQTKEDIKMRPSIYSTLSDVDSDENILKKRRNTAIIKAIIALFIDLLFSISILIPICLIRFKRREGAEETEEEISYKKDYFIISSSIIGGFILFIILLDICCTKISVIISLVLYCIAGFGYYVFRVIEIIKFLKKESEERKYHMAEVTFNIINVMVVLIRVIVVCTMNSILKHIEAIKNLNVMKERENFYDKLNDKLENKDGAWTNCFNSARPSMDNERVTNNTNTPVNNMENPEKNEGDEL